MVMTGRKKFMKVIFSIALVAVPGNSVLPEIQPHSASTGETPAVAEAKSAIRTTPDTYSGVAVVTMATPDNARSVRLPSRMPARTPRISELGTITAKQIPMVFLTSNNTRELSEALKRRCLYLHVDYPDMEREKEIVLAKVPDISANLADQIARIVRSISQLDLKKAPSVSETLDWARTLILLGVDHIDAEQAKETLHVLLKYQTDIAKAAKELSVDE